MQFSQFQNCFEGNYYSKDGDFIKVVPPVSVVVSLLTDIYWHLQVLNKYQPRTATLLPGLGVPQPVGGLVGILGGRIPETEGAAAGSFTE